MGFFFCNFLGINPSTKNFPNFDDKGLLVPGKILSSLKGKKLDPKIVYMTIRGEGPKN